MCTDTLAAPAPSSVASRQGYHTDVLYQHSFSQMHDTYPFCVEYYEEHGSSQPYQLSHRLDSVSATYAQCSYSCHTSLLQALCPSPEHLSPPEALSHT